MQNGSTVEPPWGGSTGSLYKHRLNLGCKKTYFYQGFMSSFIQSVMMLMLRLQQSIHWDGDVTFKKMSDFVVLFKYNIL